MHTIIVQPRLCRLEVDDLLLKIMKDEAYVFKMDGRLNALLRINADLSQRLHHFPHFLLSL